jgi:hypothetical protein
MLYDTDHVLTNTLIASGSDFQGVICVGRSSGVSVGGTSIGDYHGNILTTASTGGGQDYMPPYMTVYAWQRTA